MTEYHKIHSIFKRGDTGHFLFNQFSKPEFEYLARNEWEFTEKLDGTNIRVYVSDKNVPASMADFATIIPDIAFKGRTENASIPSTLVERLMAIFHPQEEELAREFHQGVTFYGEGIGSKIQKAGGNYGSVDFVLFDVKIGHWWLKRKDVEGIANKLGVKFAPVIGHGTLWDAIWLAKDGFNSRWGDFTAEGIVARPSTELKGRDGERIITKVKHKDFL